MFCKYCNYDRQFPEDYYRNKNCSSGYDTSICKFCAIERSKKKCKLKKAKYDRKRRKDKAEYLKEYERERRKLPHRRASHAESTRRRRAAKGLQTPKWADLDKIRSIYESARVLGEKFGVTYHVDHIIPLNGKDICGLHVENNLQLLECSLNLSKGNKTNTHFELPRRYYA